MTLYKVFEIADIIICEGNSSVVIESLITKKPIILFKRDYPDFTHQSQKLIKKRILIYENLKNILKLTRQFKKLPFKNLKLNDKSFLNDFYDYKTANQTNFIRCLENFVNN
jgi:CDP-glycerol glycerophosphotransferase (TagB/SpsB family)